VNRNSHTSSVLVALARTRRLQRALAHAHLHRDAPMPTLRMSLGFMTSTARITDEIDAPAHRMTVLGVARGEAVAYVVEELGDGSAPIAYRLWLAGPRAGHLVPIHAWYETGGDASEIRARLAAIAPTLEPVVLATPEAWMLSTRVVHRRALRLEGVELPIRKFALQLRVEPVSGDGDGASGHTTVTAFLDAHAELGEVWLLPDGGALARVTYTGIPSGLGGHKDVVILLAD
jgi:hypothetical protein